MITIHGCKCKDNSINVEANVVKISVNVGSGQRWMGKRWATERWETLMPWLAHNMSQRANANQLSQNRPKNKTEPHVTCPGPGILISLIRGVSCDSESRAMSAFDSGYI